jgi:hypothetical protein
VPVSTRSGRAFEYCSSSNGAKSERSCDRNECFRATYSKLRPSCGTRATHKPGPSCTFAPFAKNSSPIAAPCTSNRRRQVDTMLCHIIYSHAVLVCALHTRCSVLSCALRYALFAALRAVRRVMCFVYPALHDGGVPRRRDGQAGRELGGCALQTKPADKNRMTDRLSPRVCKGGGGLCMKRRARACGVQCM